MNNNEKDNKKENTSKYGEFVPSLHHWIPIEQQKQKAQKLSKVTKENKK